MQAVIAELHQCLVDLISAAGLGEEIHILRSTNDLVRGQRETAD